MTDRSMLVAALLGCVVVATVANATSLVGLGLAALGAFVAVLVVLAIGVSPQPGYVSLLGSLLIAPTIVNLANGSPVVLAVPAALAAFVGTELASILEQGSRLADNGRVDWAGRVREAMPALKFASLATVIVMVIVRLQPNGLAGLTVLAAVAVAGAVAHRRWQGANA